MAAKKKEIEIIPAEEPGKYLAKAAYGEVTDSFGGFYMPATNSAFGITPEKLAIPGEYHPLVRMCYDFYLRGGMASVVIDRIAELTVTDLRNGQRKTSNEANYYYESVLHRSPSRLYRFIRMMALEYFLTGMCVPRVNWKEVKGENLHPKLKRDRLYAVPTFDLYPPLLINIVWAGWGEKEFYLTIPEEDFRLLKNKNARRTKEQQARYDYLSKFQLYTGAVNAGSNKILLTDVDPILRKELSINPYPTPYLSKVLEALVFKQQLRRMDFAVASRIINAILLVQEGDKDFPLVEGDRDNLEALKTQILARSNNPALMERLFILFSNHTTKLTWISPDVEALLDQEKYRQSNEEVMEGLGFPRILVVGESKGAQAAEVSTWAIQPQMEEFRTMLLQWMLPIYEQAAELNDFRNVPSPSWSPIRLQDFVKTAAVFAQLYREGNMSRTSRNEALGLKFEDELEFMRDEYEQMKDLPTDFPEMPYNIQLPPNNAAGIGVTNQRTKTGGKKVGTTNTPVNNKNSGVRLTGQQPSTRTSPNDKPARNPARSELEDIELWSDEEVLEAINQEALRRGLRVELE